MIDTPVAGGAGAPASWAAELNALLARLPQPEAAVLDAVYRGKWDVAVVALRMSITVRQVRCHMARGLILVGRDLTRAAGAPAT